MADRSVVPRSCSRSVRGLDGSVVEAGVGVSISFWSLLISISLDKPSSRR